MLNLATLSDDAVQAALDGFKEQKDQATDEIKENIIKGPEEEKDEEDTQKQSEQESINDDSEDAGVASEALAYHYSRLNKAYETYNTLYCTHNLLAVSGQRLNKKSALALESLLSLDPSVPVNLGCELYDTCDATRVSMEGIASALNRAFEWFLQMIINACKYIIEVGQRVASYLSKEAGLRAGSGGGGGSTTEWVEDTDVTKKLNEVKNKIADVELNVRRAEMDKAAAAKAKAQNLRDAKELARTQDILDKADDILKKQQSILEGIKALEKKILDSSGIDLSHFVDIITRDGKAISLQELAVDAPSYLDALTLVAKHILTEITSFDGSVSKQLDAAFKIHSNVEYEDYMLGVTNACSAVMTNNMTMNNNLYKLFNSVSRVKEHTNKQTITLGTSTSASIGVNTHLLNALGNLQVEMVTFDAADTALLVLKENFSKGLDAVDSNAAIKQMHIDLVSGVNQINSSIARMTYKTETSYNTQQLIEQLKNYPTISGLSHVSVLINIYKAIDKSLEQGSYSNNLKAMEDISAKLIERQKRIESEITRNAHRDEQEIAQSVQYLPEFDGTEEAASLIAVISNSTAKLYTAVKAKGLVTTGLQAIATAAQFSKVHGAFKGVRDTLSHNVEWYAKYLKQIDDMYEVSKRQAEHLQRFKDKHPDVFK